MVRNVKSWVTYIMYKYFFVYSYYIVKLRIWHNHNKIIRGHNKC